MRVLQKVVRLVPNSEAVATLGGNRTDAPISPDADLLRPFGLSDFEICNLVNIRPVSLACLQTIIEEMTERLSEEQMEQILEMFREK